MDNRYHKEFVERWGFRRYFYAQIMGWLDRYFGFHLVLVTSRNPDHTLEAPPGTRREFMTPKTLAPFVNAMFDMKEDMVAAAFAKGDLCIGMYFENVFFGYGWVSTEDTEHLNGVWIKFDRKYRYHYKAWTLPEYRGRHLRGNFEMIRKIDNARGTCASIAFVASHNYPSVSSSLRYGGEVLGYAVYVDRGPIFWRWSSPGARQKGFYFFKLDKK